ncbi:uncharacterized protein EURHEDRAFT_214003 [Aspergillus ruber CBS 135680]|uniref:Uncharacterized protein n=1 Tax=Aspergillus ruber (strain CBS 135680) TaxID=1388766 RepID=A0A017SQH5_ASPRC|nr:uncharacterized protein EURHEDRAFT_214003 [Aspergillus ruber CBS 135680]EYE98515.1 hypothetical protein EURHEDRAFT_214003 [Aspergillus ruber CBS 135680]
MVSENDTNRNQIPPNNNISPRSTRQWPDDDNPFVAFRRYADEQISSMLQSVMGLPSMATPPIRNRWSIFADDSYDNARAKRPGENSNSEDGALSRQDNSLDAYRYCNRWWDGFVGFPGFWRSDFDDVFPFGSRFMLPFFSTFDEGFDDTASWPGAYLLFSPYSPLNLEGSSLGGQREGGVFSSLVLSLRPDGSGGVVENNAEPRWHEAFEDLVRLENKQQMLERGSGIDAVSKKETGMDWLKGMIQRGSLGDGWKWQQADDNPNNGYAMLERGQLPHSSKRAAETENVKKDNMDLTEQDLYEHFLKGLERREREFSRIFDESRTLRFLLGDPRRKNELLERQRRLPEEADNGTGFDAVTAETNRTPALESSQPISIDQAKTEPLVVSTHANIRRNRMADGSIHTKTVRTQRFSDGHEETNESVDVANSPEQRFTVDQGGENSSNEGWFWR